MHYLYLVTAAIVVQFAIINEGAAQMFSVGDEDAVYTTPTSAFNLGVVPYDFSFQGDPEQLAGDGFDDYSFNELVYRLRLELPGFHLHGALGPNLTGEGSLNFLNVGVQIQGGTSLYSREQFGLSIPLEIGAELTQVNSDVTRDNRNDFRQSSIQIGMGLGLRWRPFERIRLKTENLPMVGFSVASQTREGGIRYLFESRNRIYFDNVFRNMGLVAGGDFKISRFDISANEYQYDTRGNSIMIGITF